MPAGDVALVVGGGRVDVTRATAEAVVEHLWKGLEHGAVTAAARLADFLGSADGASALVFPAYEELAVRDALEAVGHP